MRAIKRKLWKWFGLISTVILGAVALTPDAFNIPHEWRPWLFLASIFWFFLFVTGSFNL